MVEISIVVPVYNGEKYINKLLMSIYQQSFTNYEVIIIDDNSNDNTLKVVKKFCQEDSRFNYFSFDENRGVSEARNQGIKMAKGNFIFFIDGDDYITRNCLKEIHSRLDDSTDALMLNYKVVNEQGESINPHTLHFFEEKFPDHCVDGREAFRLLLTHQVSHWPFETIIRKSVLLKHGILFPAGRAYGEDFATIYKELFFSRKVCFIKDKLYYYVQRASSVMHNHRLKDSVDYYETILEIDSFIKSNILEFQSEKEFYVLPRLINAYSIQCKFPNLQDKKFMSVLKKNIITRYSVLRNTHFSLDKRDKIKIALIKCGLLRWIYLAYFYKNRIRKNNEK
ncbi:glycosyltransferase [Pediococcus acidilactici]|uniref:glycosyltransferase family 2 protein n=1 Tax=Pediococcus acidilactici TaxID=1254 RepID=UPI0013251B61|nr:glycosyltransferase family 2 protein [Pediococcus acidilactici]KAF0362062.1 glycosyltransferase [Pediococcus acidilactici]KAF0365819.1 glycosyltransferase [Pediococcus acidilactici]KAF0416705.1 glycosyltransferase [Pediococcus acidilactici]KAF0420374.1 glycosyltransferase [Pediococcus acidilactici]KAF0472302.1 glycosyltransferase [Pediococcus acidilactici]